MMILANREGEHQFDIPAGWHLDRKPGLSGLVRLRNEAEWCGLALESFVDWCDELIVVLNCCDDETPQIVEEFRANHPAIVQVFDYPFPNHPMGPGHDGCPSDSVQPSAYYYNFTLAQSTRTHATKLDGDFVMMDWAGAEIRGGLDEGHDRVTWHGTDLAGDLKHIGCDPVSMKSDNTGTFRVTKETYWEQGPLTQHMRGAPLPTKRIGRPAFVHFKWIKPFDSATVQWPDNWREIPHFKNIAARRHPVAPYQGEYPSAVRERL